MRDAGDDFGGMGGDDDNDEGGAWEGMGSPGIGADASSELVAAPRQVSRISVTYAKAAKQVSLGFHLLPEKVHPNLWDWLR